MIQVTEASSAAVATARAVPDGGNALEVISVPPALRVRPAGSPAAITRVCRAGRSVPICSAVSGWEATAMPVTEREIYRSSNGDRWDLVQERGSDRGYVRHQPNRASGGQSSLTDVREFLAEGHGPQHEALLRLLGKVRV